AGSCILTKLSLSWAHAARRRALPSGALAVCCEEAFSWSGVESSRFLRALEVAFLERLPCPLRPVPSRVSPRLPAQHGAQPLQLELSTLR
ncbi:unnamed protein product, partial [Gulo gulo]